MYLITYLIGYKLYTTWYYTTWYQMSDVLGLLSWVVFLTVTNCNYLHLFFGSISAIIIITANTANGTIMLNA